MTMWAKSRTNVFTLQELLTISVLAALGGMSSSLVSLTGKALSAATGMFGGLQLLAGMHVLWLVLALGLVRKPAAASLTGLLKGAVELFCGNPHGLLVLAYSGLAGLAVDSVWYVLGRRHHPVVYGLAGGAATLSNLLMIVLIFSLPIGGGVLAGLALVASVAFASGVLLAGLLGWHLLAVLRRAGVVSPSAAPG